MTPRHAADRLTARVRAWWTERRARRDAREDEEVAWLDTLPLPEDFGDIGPWNPAKIPGQRYQGPHAKPGDIPDQPAGGAE